MIVNCFKSSLSRGIVLRAPYTSSTSKLMAVDKMTVQDFGKIWNDTSRRELYQVIDVRESNELDVASLKPLSDVIHLPLSTAG